MHTSHCVRLVQYRLYMRRTEADGRRVKHLSHDRLVKAGLQRNDVRNLLTALQYESTAGSFDQMHLRRPGYNLRANRAKLWTSSIFGSNVQMILEYLLFWWNIVQIILVLNLVHIQKPRRAIYIFIFWKHAFMLKTCWNAHWWEAQVKACHLRGFTSSRWVPSHVNNKAPIDVLTLRDRL